MIGFTWFAGLKIEVNPSVLIPRPETEELFYLVKNEHQGPKKIVDWCSGSGCLTLALHDAFPNGVVYGLEFSAQAIDTAKKSSSALGIQPCWRQSNIFEAWPEEIRNCDIIVSNPPYVAQKEAGYLSKHVLDHEPHLALFVPDHTPLLFYERLLLSGKEYLKPGGKLYCEINPIYAEELLMLAITLGWKDAQTRKDIFGKERFLIAHHQD